MPEICEIRRITDKLRNRLKDQILLSINWVIGTKYSSIFDKAWSMYKHLFPTKCLDILCRGKQIFFFLENGVSFISSLGMEGHWYYFKSKQEERQPLDNYLSRTNYRKFCLYFGSQVEIDGTSWLVPDTEIWYDDMLSYGNFKVGNWNDAFSKMKELGTDLLAATTPLTDIHSTVKQYLPTEFFEIATLERFSAAIKMPRRSGMLLCVFLLKHQEIYSGCGNWLLCEVLYMSKLHPNRILGSLSDNDIQTLFFTCLNVISNGYKCGGLTHGTFLDPDMEKGHYQVLVYKREGYYDPNGYLIKRIKVATGRSCFIVEELQK